MSIQFGDIPTWLASLGTVGALVAALYQISNERQRRLTQESHDRQERHQAQARLVSAWVGKSEERNNIHEIALELINGSSEPVYGLAVGIVFIQGAAPHSLEEWFDAKKKSEIQEHRQLSPPIAILSVLPPGRWRAWVQDTGDVLGGGRRVAEIAFTDRAGAYWIRRGRGNLEELPIPPFEHFHKFGMYGPPYDYRMPEPLE